MALKVVIAGAGFAGFRLARKLNNQPGFEVLLIDKFNYHQFQPLFYQVATAALDASNISFPLRRAFHNSKNVRIRIEEIKEVLPGQNKIITEAEVIGYDILVLAMGADTNFFGNQNLASNAFPMKSTVEALQIRHRLVQNFEDALLAKDPLQYQKLMNIVIVGGGPTGVEVAGAIADMKRYVLPKDYPELDFSRMNIYLLEGTGRTLSPMSEKSSEDSCRYLKKMGVTVMTNALVKDYDGEQVVLNDGKTIAAKIVIWAAGVKGNVPAGIDKSLIVRGNRIKVDRHCKVEGTTTIYALGDLAYMGTQKYPKGHPQLASVAIQQADVLAKNLRLMKGKSKMIYEFEYYDKGSLATIGRNLAVVDLPIPKAFGSQLHLRGFFAWLIWMSLHLFLILGVKNKVMIFVNWVYNYFTYDQNLRLIFREFYRPKKSEAVKQTTTPVESANPNASSLPSSSSPLRQNDEGWKQAAGFKR